MPFMHMRLYSWFWIKLTDMTIGCDIDDIHHRWEMCTEDMQIILNPNRSVTNSMIKEEKKKKKMKAKI